MTILCYTGLAATAKIEDEGDCKGGCEDEEGSSRQEKAAAAKKKAAAAKKQAAVVAAAAAVAAHSSGCSCTQQHLQLLVALQKQ